MPLPVVKKPNQIAEVLKSTNHFLLVVYPGYWKFSGGQTLKYNFCKPCQQANDCFEIDGRGASIPTIIQTIEKIASQYEPEAPYFIEIVVKGIEPIRKPLKEEGEDL